MMAFTKGLDVWVDFEGAEWPGEVLKDEGEWVQCLIAVDPLWDFGSASARVMPLQTVTVKAGRVRER